MNWLLFFQILFVVITAAQIAFGVCGIFLKGKTAKGQHAKGLHKKYGGEWYAHEKCGGVWFEKGKEKYSFWWNTMTYCLGLLIANVFIGLGLFYYPYQ